MRIVALWIAFFALGALVAGGVVWAQAPSQITACVERATGYFKLGSTCGGQVLTWNTQGPQGPAGPVGPPGATGPQGPPGSAATALVPTTVVYANSAINKASGHSVTARCPSGATALYGGAGLITPGKADAAQLRIVYSRPTAVQGVPRGWSAGGIRVDSDPRLALALSYLAVAVRSALVTHHLFSHRDNPPELYADEAKQWSAATPGRWAQAIAGASEAADPPSPRLWGVQAWVVCGPQERAPAPTTRG